MSFFISELEDTVAGVQFQVLELEDDIAGLDQRVSDLESGGGGANVTGNCFVLHLKKKAVCIHLI